MVRVGHPRRPIPESAHVDIGDPRNNRHGRPPCTCRARRNWIDDLSVLPWHQHLSLHGHDGSRLGAPRTMAAHPRSIPGQCAGVHDAIASRQYMVAFPLAVAAHEFFSRSCVRTDQPRKLRWPAFAWILPTIAAASLLAWIGVFGGPAPHRAIETQRLVTADAVSVFPQHSLYFLSFIGVYFVLVETMLFWRWQELARAIRSRRAWIAAVLLIAAFVLFPPLKNLNYDIESMGYLDLALRAVMGDGPRVAVLCLLAVLVCARWRQINLAWWLLSLNAVVMMKAHIGWDKYALALLMSLWWLKARGNLDEAPGQA